MLAQATAQNFQAVVTLPSYQTPVLVDFGASWCGPCQALHPLLERFAREFAGQVVVATVDIDADPELAERFGVKSVPTMVLVYKNQIAARHVGNPGSVEGIKSVMGFLKCEGG